MIEIKHNNTVLVTGSLGYIGSVLTPTLKTRGYEVLEIDTNYYKSFPPTHIESSSKLIIKDVRDIEKPDLTGVGAIIHLAALSNDPLGDLDSGLTDAVNHQATIRLATMAKETGVQRFVFPSSQSVYGRSLTDRELTEADPVAPVTAYAKSKWDVEVGLRAMADDNFIVTCFRPSTIYGSSPNFRDDLVYNNLLAAAYTTGEVVVNSDGTPWRPICYLPDVCMAFIAGLEAPAEVLNKWPFNVGVPGQNYTVKELAEAATRAVPNSHMSIRGEKSADERTYKVNFDKILNELGRYYHPTGTPDRGGAELVRFFQETEFDFEIFSRRERSRLSSLNHLIKNGVLNDELRWVSTGK